MFYCRVSDTQGEGEEAAGRTSRGYVTHYITRSSTSRLIQTELFWDRDQNGSLYFMLKLHIATYVGT